MKGWAGYTKERLVISMSIPLHHPKSSRIQEGLERLVLYGLACEWEEALWILDSPYLALMKMPFFSLRDRQKTLGRWLQETHEISLSRSFVFNHPWDAVREVLVHEMALQFADEVLVAHGEPPHGPKFQQACHLLRANPRASGNYPPLDERIARESPDSEDKIMVKVKKLMALAESQNQHEAELAMAKAHALIAKHNLDVFAGSDIRDFATVFLGKPALRHFREEYHLSKLLLDFYFVYGIWVPAYVVEKGKMGRVLEISGTISNIQIACYVHDFVRNFIDSQWEQYNRGKGLNRYRKTDFAVGIVQGLRSKLDSQRNYRTGAESGRALMEIEDPLLVEYAAYRYPRTRNVGRRRVTQDQRVLKEGIKVGKELVISRGITDGGEEKIFLLEDKNE